jgi:hypothetical protein
MATVDRRNRPRSRVVHPVWEIRDGALHGLVGTRPTPLKRARTRRAPGGVARAEPVMEGVPA